MRRWTLGAVALAGVVVLGAIAGYDTYYQANYVHTAYAYVTAPYEWVSVANPATVTQVMVHAGQQVRSGAPLLRVKTAAGRRVTVNARAAGTVGSIGVATGASIAPEEDLMALVHTAQSTVVAVVPESASHRVSVGQTANVTLSAYPGTTFTGTVAHIGATTLTTLSPLLQVGTFSKERQWVPVTIDVSPGTDSFIAGENASVRIDV